MRIKILVVILLLVPIIFTTSKAYMTDEQHFLNSVNQPENQTIFIGLNLFNIEFEFYQVSQVVFIGNSLKNVSISVNSVVNVTIIDNKFEETTGPAIIIWDSNNVSIERNSFSDAPEVPISVYETTGTIVRENTVELSQSNDNPWALLVGINIDRSPKTRIAFNDVYSPIGDGIYIHSSENSFVLNNSIHQTGFIGLSIISSDNTEVINNTITDSSWYHAENPDGDIPPSSAIGISNSPSVLIKNNIINYSDYTGIDVVSSNNIRIDSNMIINHLVSGVFIGLTDNVVVVNNILYNNGNDIEIDQVNNLITTNNTITSESPIFDSISRSIISNNNEVSLNFIFILSIITYVFISRKKIHWL